uniref:Zinc-dependent metalloprotease n=1 Tax=Bursaphelenchus xylophilus TaxID=6326 RepID=A0A1I7SG55_BURXY
MSPKTFIVLSLVIAFTAYGKSHHPSPSPHGSSGNHHGQNHGKEHDHGHAKAHDKEHGKSHGQSHQNSQGHEHPHDHGHDTNHAYGHQQSHQQGHEHPQDHGHNGYGHKGKSHGHDANDNGHHEGNENMHLDKDGNFINPQTQQVLKELSELHFVKPMETENVPCEHLLRPQIDKNPFAKKYRLTYKDPDFEEDLATDCESIWLRNNFYTKPLSREEEDFPLAFARNVYKDYRFIEMELSTTYAPQNLYCFGIDGKSDALFQLRMRNLSQCFNNVFLTEHRYTMDSKGHNTNLYHIECMKNHDVSLHTNEELVHILTTFHGTNDISTVPTRPAKKIKWDFENMRVFKN